ncbi:MAG: general secretion pathway protein GspK [Candidatus Omnitrophica bacterium]|nr:general secretion pathway protein GspK [Candidatus Omnitrophota bacterium]
MALMTRFLRRPFFFPVRVKRAGSILVIALWAVSMLSAFAVILGYQVRQRLTLAHRLDEKERLALAAEAGARRGIAELLKEGQEKTFDHLGEPWSLNEEAFKDGQMQGLSYRVGYEHLNPINRETKFWYGMADEERKVNLNTAELLVMQRLFERLLGLSDTQAQELAAAVVDWRDENNEPALPTAGAEDAYYQGLSAPYEAKDAPFEVPEELLLVKGMTVPFFKELEGFITVYGDGGVNINTAPLEVLVALGLSEDLAEDIITYRQGQDGECGTEDDLYFKAPSEIVPQLSDVFALDADEINSINRLTSSVLGTRSFTFFIHSTAEAAAGNAASRVYCVADRKGDVFYWRAE